MLWTKGLSLTVKPSQVQRLVSRSLATYDLAVIGSGPGGYVAAIRAAQNGLKTVCIEKNAQLGGTCLNVGCIPSKILLNTSHKYHDARHLFPSMGIRINGTCDLDLDAVNKQKLKIMARLCKGIEGLFKLNKVDLVRGEARFNSPTSLDVVDPSTATVQCTIEAKNILIATGSEPAPLPGCPVVPDESTILTSTGALQLKEVPKSMVVVGAGAIGLELGSVYNRLGTQVTVVEFAPTITPGLDSEISSAFHQILKKQKCSFHLGHKVVGIKKEAPAKVRVEIQSATTQETQTLECEKVLIAVGRRPYTSQLGLANLNVHLDQAGRVPVDDHLRVIDQPTVFAIGDVVRGAMLAHKAEDEGFAVADFLAGKTPHLNYEAIPSVIYTHPEVAGVGRSEDDLVQANRPFSKGVFPIGSNSRALLQHDTDGFVKIVADPETNKVLGAWIIGPSAGELIHEMAVAVDHGLTVQDIARTCHAHPTLSEAMREASLATFSKAIHGR